MACKRNQGDNSDNNFHLLNAFVVPVTISTYTKQHGGSSYP